MENVLYFELFYGNYFTLFLEIILLEKSVDCILDCLKNISKINKFSLEEDRN